MTARRYYLAHNLKGFRNTTLRVRLVERLNDECSNVTTADLLDSGTPLTLDNGQLEFLEEERCPKCGENADWCPEMRRSR